MRAAEYLKIKQIPYSKFRVNAINPDIIKKSLNINLLSTESNNKYLTLKKTNFRLRIKFNQKYNVENVLQDLTKISKYFVNVCDLHPCPKTYALFHVLKNRNYGLSVNYLL